MNIFTKFFTDPTDFKAGGLRPSMLSATMRKLSTPSNFVAPRKLDFRDMCLPSNDQGNSSKCAAYSSAGHIEVRNWRTNHYPEQIDPNPIYTEAKKIDGDTQDGTTLNSVAQAVLNLKLIKGKPEYIDNDMNQIKFAIHQFTTMVGGFLINSSWNRVGSDGIIPNTPGAVLGGHAILVTGFDDKGIYIQNSWGGWGLYGFGMLSWEMCANQFMGGMVINESN